MACKRPLNAFQEAPGAPLKFGVPLGASNVQIACGQCAPCRLERSRQWALRILAENTLHKPGSTWFLTLTYDNAHLPPKADPTADRHTLRPRDLTLFWKKARKAFGKFRYFACGEYGDRTLRPHYHAIIFGLNLLDQVKPIGRGLSVCQNLTNTWGHGHAVLAPVNFETAAYVARYNMKKLTGKAKPAHETYHAEYLVMSRRPGIGYDALLTYFTDYFPHPESTGEFHVPNRGTFALPKFFDRKLKDALPDYFSDISATRIASLPASRRGDYHRAAHAANVEARLASQKGAI